MAQAVSGSSAATGCAVMMTLAFASFSAPAHAQDDSGQIAATLAATPATAIASDDLFALSPVGDSALASANGREQVQFLSATSTNNAVVSDNHVGDNSVTGNVSLSDSAFQNMSGISMVNFNTGNGSSINAAMSVNVQINYATPGQ